VVVVVVLGFITVLYMRAPSRSARRARTLSETSPLIDRSNNSNRRQGGGSYDGSDDGGAGASQGHRRNRTDAECLHWHFYGNFLQTAMRIGKALSDAQFIKVSNQAPKMNSDFRLVKTSPQDYRMVSSTSGASSSLHGDSQATEELIEASKPCHNSNIKPIQPGWEKKALSSDEPSQLHSELYDPITVANQQGLEQSRLTHERIQNQRNG
jgi:hypothetical protein